MQPISKLSKAASDSSSTTADASEISLQDHHAPDIQATLHMTMTRAHAPVPDDLSESIFAFLQYSHAGTGSEKMCSDSMRKRPCACRCPCPVHKSPKSSCEGQDAQARREHPCAGLTDVALLLPTYPAQKYVKVVVPIPCPGCETKLQRQQMDCGSWPRV